MWEIWCQISKEEKQCYNKSSKHKDKIWKPKWDKKYKEWMIIISKRWENYSSK